MAVEDAAGYAALSGATFTGDVNVTGDASLGGSTLTVDDAGNSVTLGNGTDLYLQNNRRIMIDNATGTPLVALTIDSSNQWKFLNNAITASGVWLAVGPNAPGARLDVQQSADNRNNGIRVSPVGAFSEARMYVDASGNFAVGRGSSDYLTMNSGGDVALTGALDVAGGAFTVDDVTGDVAVGSAEWHESDGWFVLPNTGELRFKNSAGTRQTAFEWQATDRLYIGSTATHITYLTSGDNFYLRTNGANTALRIDNNQKATFYADFQADGNVDFTALPTTDPAVAGRLWNDSGTVKISAG